MYYNPGDIFESPYDGNRYKIIKYFYDSNHYRLESTSVIPGHFIDVDATEILNYKKIIVGTFSTQNTNQIYNTPTTSQVKKFKPGDKVKCLNDSSTQNPGFSAGSIYEVDDPAYTPWGTLAIKSDNHGQSNGWDASNFELDQSPSFWSGSSYAIPIKIDWDWAYKDSTGIWTTTTTTQPAISKKCECGSHKVYGENCSADMHASYCPLFEGRK